MKVLAIIAALALASPPDADACTCRSPDVTVTPSGDLDAPLETTIMVWVPERFAKYPDGRTGNVSYAVRVAGNAIEVTTKSVKSGETEVVELVPKRKLAPNTKHWIEVTKDGKVAKRVLFTTGDGKTKPTAPAWKAQGLAHARYVEPKMSGGGSCINRDATLQLIWFIDDPKPERLRVGIWVGAPIDLSKPPTTYIQGSKQTIVTLGNPTYCASATLTIPSDPKLEVAAKLFDIAGNASDARAVTVNTTRPEVEAY